MDSPVN